MSAHTPGPWEVHESQRDFYIVPVDVGGEDIDVWLASTPRRTRRAHRVADRALPPTDVDRANAQLMATAPQLLDLLERLVDECGYALPPDTLREARAVVDKARGAG